MMLKKLSNTAFIYTVLALVVGVVYREYTKLSGFTGQTNLSLLHTHLFTLGMMFFLIVLALEVTLRGVIVDSYDDGCSWILTN